MTTSPLRTLVLLATGLAVATPAHAQGALEDVTVAVPNFTFTLTPTLVADELKLWEKHGLRFKMVQIQGVGATNAVISGSADFAQAGGSAHACQCARPEADRHRQHGRAQHRQHHVT